MVDAKSAKLDTIYAELKHVHNMLIVGDVNDYEMQGCTELLLYQASSLGLTDVLQSLLSHHDVLSKMHYYVSGVECTRLLYDCLATAHQQKHNDVIRFLLEFSFSKPANTTSRTTKELLEELVLLHCAAGNGDVETAAILINFGIDVNKTNSEGETALHFACNAATAEFLLINGADIDAMNAHNETPLYYACVAYRLGVIRKLVEKGANPYLGSTYELLGEACESDRDIARALKKISYVRLNSLDIPVSCMWSAMHGTNGSASFPWCTSCKHENQLLIQTMSVKKPEVDANRQKTTKNNKSLHSAIQTYSNNKTRSGVADKSEIKRILSSTNNSANINALDNSGTTALYQAVERNLMEVATLLLESGADPNLTTSGKYPLTVACRYLSHEFVRLLLDRGADPNVSDCYDNSPLFIAAASCDHRLVKLLIEHGADVNHCDRKGRTTFHPLVDGSDCQSCTSPGIGSIECAKYLLEKGLNINPMMISSAEQESVVYYAANGIHNPYRNGKFARKSIRYRLFEMVLERGADVNLLLSELHLTHATYYSFVVKDILRYGADPNRPDKNGVNLVSRTCMKLSTYRDRILLAPGADPNSATWDSLVRSTADYSIKLIDFLLDSGAILDDPKDTNGLYNREFQPPKHITLHDFYMPVCMAAGWIARLFKAGSTPKLLATCCKYTRSRWLMNPYPCTSTGRLCQAVVFAGHKVQQEQRFLKQFKQSEWRHVQEMGAWQEEYSRTPPRLLCLSRAVVRCQLSEASGCRTIIPLINRLPISVNLRMYLKFEGPLSEIDLNYDNVSVSCESCNFEAYRQSPAIA